jgi:hypothetical protein
MTAEIIPFVIEDGEPAFMERTAAGLIVHGIWTLDEERHRIGAPAVIKHDRRTGVCVGEEWWLRGKFQRAVERDAKTEAVKPERAPQP